MIEDTGRVRRVLPRDPHEGVKIENDVIGVRLWGPATAPTLTLGGADIWDRRWFAERQPLITLAKIRDCAETGRISEIAKSPNSTAYHLYQQYDFPCPKPGAQLILQTPFGEEAWAEVTDEFLGLEVAGNGKRLLVKMWVSLEQRLVVLECRQTGLAVGDFSIRVYRHRDTISPGEPIDLSIGGGPSGLDFEQLPMPSAFVNKDTWGIEQQFASDSTFPAGFRFTIAAIASDASVELAVCKSGNGLGTTLWAEKEGRLDHGTVKRYSPINEAAGAAATASFTSLPESFAVFATVATLHDADNPVEHAIAFLRTAAGRGLAEHQKEQAAAFHSARRPLPAEASIAGAAVLTAPPVVLPNLRRKGGYYGDIPMCSVGPTKYCFQDAGLWHADFHLNEIRAEPLLTLGRFEDVFLFAEMIRTLLPQAEENAADVYDLPGAMYPLVHFPLRCRGITHTNLTWEQDIGLNGLVAKPLWLYYRYTGDTEFLREIAYPVMKSCARFCTAYLSEGDDGYLHLIPTVSPEHWGLTAQFERNRDCTSALTLTKYLLNTSSKAAVLLGVDAAEAAQWRAAARRMVGYPTVDVDAGTIWTDVSGAPPSEYNIPVPLSPVFWGDDVGLDSSTETLTIAHRTLAQINVWQPHRFYLDTCVRPRLGLHADGAAIVPEAMLLSYQSIHMFAGAPLDVEIVVENFAAEGGFRVSARRSANGYVSDAALLSTLGGSCTITLPNEAQSRTFETRPGEILRL